MIIYSVLLNDSVKRTLDPRDPATIPLNFTKSINLALSERGINSLKRSNCDGLLDDVLKKTIPMHGRMIHGQRKNGTFFQESQSYDAHGRVICSNSRPGLGGLTDRI